MRIVIVVTSHCNAACVHCAKSYGPRRRQSLDRDTIFRVMDQAAEVEDDEALQFDLSGGEPFIDFTLLTEVVAHGANLNGNVSCVTNAYWAKTDDVAREKLQALQTAGLTELAVSASRFHQQFIPIERVDRALTIANELGIYTEFKGGITRSDLAPGSTLDNWKHSLRADCINIFPILPYLRDVQSLPEDEYWRDPGLPIHRCPGDRVSVDFDGSVRSCCALTSGKFLAIGDVRLQTVSELHETLLSAAKQRILRDRGPIAFARQAIHEGLGDRLRNEYAGPCDLCLHIQADEQLRASAERYANSLR